MRDSGCPHSHLQPESGRGRADGGKAPAGGFEPGGPGGPGGHEALGGLFPVSWAMRCWSATPRTAQGTARFAGAVRELLADKLRAYAEKGQVGRVVRVMILGIPNVGKSTFINRVAGRKTAKTEDRPGVTRSKQWVPIDSESGAAGHPRHSLAQV